MAELLVKAIDATHPDPATDRQGCYKRGMPVLVKPDGHPWGLEERRPKFVVIKIPGIAPERLEKYTQPMFDLLSLKDVPPTIQRRRWRLRWADLPQRAQNILQNSGHLVIRAGSYTGTADYTWDQIKKYFRDDETGLDELGTL